MTTKFNRVNTTNIHNRRVTALILLGSAISFGSQVAQADTGFSTAPAALARQAAPAAHTETGVPPKVQPFQTAPSLNNTPTINAPLAQHADVGVGAGAPNVAGAPMASAGTSAPTTGSTAKLEGANQADNVPWVLPAEYRPWTLTYVEPAPLNALGFTLPTEKEARMMLPGHASDAAERARFEASQYFKDNIGSALQSRSRQLETFNNWAANTQKQKSMLPKGDWVAYQFSQESQAIFNAFKSKVQGQTESSLARMADDVKKAVASIIPVMDATSSYEQKTQWYGVLTKLKEGVGLYQTQVAEADQKLMAAITAFERLNPPVARPQGNPPAAPSDVVGAPAPAAAAPANLTPEVKRDPAPVPAAPAQSPSHAGGIIIVIGMVLVALWMFMKLRKRVANQAGPKDGSNS